MNNQVEIIASEKINLKKWDDCISNSNSSLIYATSIYLNHCCENWMGIIINDFSCVMPVPYKKKFGIRYCYSVPFIQQLGYFSKTGNDFLADCLLSLNKICKYGDYAFNYSNKVNGNKRNNFILDLSNNYSAISFNYNKDFKRNLQKAARNEFSYKPASVEEAIAVYKEHYAIRTPHVTAMHFQNFENLCRILVKSETAFARKIVSAKGELLAIALLLSDKRRIYNLMNSTTSLGKKLSSNYMLLDRIFNEFSSHPLLFDFEGSDIEGIKNFYEKTGAALEAYSTIHINHLPFPLSKIKR